MTSGVVTTGTSRTAGVASLPMYTLPEIADTAAAWWRGGARHMRAAGASMVPDILTQPPSVLAHWTDSNLVFSQTCGFPLVYTLKDRVRMIATPVYDVGDIDTNDNNNSPDYRSMIIVAEDLAATEFAHLQHLDAAVNSRDSQSGFNAFRALIARVTDATGNRGEKFFARTIITGSHENSIKAVRTGTAHCACIDGVTLALFQRYRPSALAGVRVLCQTDPAPGLPFITRGNVTDDELQALREGLFAALADPLLVPLAHKQLLKGAAILEPDDYNRISRMADRGCHVTL